MSNEHSNAVRKSDLYEHGGTRKALLTEIGSLIFDAANPWGGLEPPKWWHPEYAGWCVSSQDHLAAAIGCSVEEANREIAEFEADGWLTVKKFRDERGYPRCHYTITPQQLAKIKAREMKKDEKKHYIRA